MSERRHDGSERRHDGSERRHDGSEPRHDGSEPSTATGRRHDSQHDGDEAAGTGAGHQHDGAPGANADADADANANAVLAGRYTALLRAYPKAWRYERGGELVGTLLDAAEPGRRRPSLRESASILLQGTRERLGLRRRRTPGAVWSEGLRIGALMLLAQKLTALLHFTYDGGLDLLPARVIAWSVVAAVLAVGAILGLITGRTRAAAVLTGLWAAVPVASDGVSHLLLIAFVILAGLSVAERAGGRRPISAVWLAVAPVNLLLWLGYHLLTGFWFTPAYTVIYPLALLAAVTVGVVADPRLPIAVAVLTVVVLLDQSLHVPAPLASYPAAADATTLQLGPAAVVLAAITVVLLTIGHLRARQLQRI